MKVNELISVIFDNVTIYKAIDDGFEDIYIGNTKDIPLNILNMNVKCIGAKEKGVIDIKVI